MGPDDLDTDTPDAASQFAGLAHLEVIAAEQAADPAGRKPDMEQEQDMSYPHYSTECDEHHGLVRDFSGDRPPIVCLCGSTRFFDAFRQVNLNLTLAGEIVLSIGCDTKSDADLGIVAGDLAPAKIALDELHKRKIDLADYVLVVSDETGYFGESTASEIAYAVKHGKPVRFTVEAAGERALAAGLMLAPDAS